MQQIPIRINRKGSNLNEIAFKIFPIQKKLLISHRRQKTFDSMEKQKDQMKNERKHDTLDPQRLKGESRYRRISSSGGTHKFPKDFFNHNDLPRTPIKIRFSKTKRDPLLQSGNNFNTKFNNTRSQQCKLSTKKYTLESPQRNCQQLICQVQTPKFNLKDFTEDQLDDTISRTTSKKVKLEEYLSHKKQQFPMFFKQSVMTKEYSNEQEDVSNKIDQKTTLLNKNYRNQNDIKYESGNEQNEVLLQTLGKKTNLIKENFMKENTTEIKKRKRIQSHMEKENRLDVMLDSRPPAKKSIKAFLSTKGFNWKILQKINQMKGVSGEEPKGFSLNFKQQKNLLGLKMTKGLSQKTYQDENILANTFRIRKCT